MMPGTRAARVSLRSTSPEQVAAFLPSNYSVVLVAGEFCYISGRDNAGWTLGNYVIPRLASGLIYAEEVSSIPN